MTLSLLFRALTVAAACVCPQSERPATLVVQAVDHLWLPLPGATVTAHLPGQKESYREPTDRDGFACLAIPAGGEYTVEVTLEGFKPRSVKGVPVRGGPEASLPHVQIQLSLDESYVGVTDVPQQLTVPPVKRVSRETAGRRTRR